MIRINNLTFNPYLYNAAKKVDSANSADEPDFRSYLIAASSNIAVEPDKVMLTPVAYDSTGRPVDPIGALTSSRKKP